MCYALSRVRVGSEGNALLVMLMATAEEAVLANATTPKTVSAASGRSAEQAPALSNRAVPFVSNWFGCGVRQRRCWHVRLAD